MVFSAMPQHRDEWWKHRHQYAEATHMMGLPIPSDIKPVMNRWFNLDPSFKHNWVAFAPFGGNGEVNDKQLSMEQAEAIVAHLRKRGYLTVHLGAPNEPRIQGAHWKYEGSYFDAVRTMLSCRLLIHCDTGMGHFAGAYNHPSLGLYGWRYHGEEGLKHIQPLHDRFRAIAAPKVEAITLDSIAQALDTILT